MIADLLTSVAYTTPALLVLLVVGVLAVLRRDDGVWWRLVVAGVAVLVLQALFGATLPYLFARAGGVSSYRFFALVGQLFYLAGIGLIGAGAVLGRRGPTDRGPAIGTPGAGTGYR